MRGRIAALVLVALAAACAACSGGSSASAAPSGAAAATQVPAICVNVASLRTTVEKLTTLDAQSAGVNAVRLAANNVVTQTATFVSAAPADLKQAAQGLKTAVDAVRSAASQAGQSGSGSAGLAAAIASVDAAWKELEAKLAVVCPS